VDSRLIDRSVESIRRRKFLLEIGEKDYSAKYAASMEHSFSNPDIDSTMLRSLEYGQSNFNIAQRDSISMNPYRLLSVALSFPFLADLKSARCSAAGKMLMTKERRVGS
jgi:hypothetical protein